MQNNADVKRLVLASGGLDSTVLLYDQVKLVGAENVIALSLYYGQKHKKELEYLRWTVTHLGVKYYIENLEHVFNFNRHASALIEGSDREIEHASYAEQLKTTGTVSAYVPYRNGLFLSYAAAVAYQEGASVIAYGAHKDDAAGQAYPDCTVAFIEAQRTAIVEGTGGQVTMIAPWMNFNKADVVRRGIELGMTEEEFAHTWSCYEGGDKPCGKCGTCIDRIAAFEANGLKDPILD